MRKLFMHQHFFFKKNTKLSVHRIQSLKSLKACIINLSLPISYYCISFSQILQIKKFKKTLKSCSFYKDSVIFANRMKIDSRDLWAKISVSSRNDCLPENHRRFRRSHPEVIIRKGVLKKCGKFTGGHPCPSVISIKLLCNFHCVKSDQNTEFFLVRIFPH